MRVLLLILSVTVLVLFRALPLHAARDSDAEGEPGPDSLTNPNYNPVCPIGYYCANGVTRPCPSGTYGSEYGLSDEKCSGDCGLMWNSPPGSMSCYNLSTAGDAIVGIIVIIIVGIVTAGTYYVRSKAIDDNWLQRLGILSEAAANADGEIVADVRSITQRQIRAGVDALAARIVQQSFPSVLALSSSLMQFNLTTAQHVNQGVTEARKELVDHIKEILLQHPRVRFDDETFPAKLPLWAEVDPSSEDGAQEIQAASNIISPAIRTAVENDVLEWFRRQQQGEGEPVYEEAQQGLLSEAAGGIPSRWPSVDAELKIALRTAFAESSLFQCFSSGSRVSYSEPSAKPLVIDAIGSFFRLAIDILVLVACFLCFRGDALIALEVPFDQGGNSDSLTATCSKSVNPNIYRQYGVFQMYPYRMMITWNDVKKPSITDTWYPWLNPAPVPCGFTFTRNSLVLREDSLFQPILDSCTDEFGRTYRFLLVFTCVCFWFAILPSFVAFCNTCMRLTPGGQGLSDLWKKKCQSIVPSVFRNDVHAWLVGVVAMIRLFGTLGIVAAVGMYSTACIARLNKSPAIVESKAWFFLSSRVVSVQYSVVMQAAFIISIVAASLALFTAALAMQKAFRMLRDSDNNQPPAPIPGAINHRMVEVHMVNLPARAIHDVAAVQVHPLEAMPSKEQAVTFHTRAEVAIPVNAFPVAGETDVGANLHPVSQQEGRPYSIAESSSVAIATPSPGATEAVAAVVDAEAVEGTSTGQHPELSQEHP